MVDGFSGAIVLDLRDYPARNTEEPEKERVMRGSRDGFVETVIFNTALIRRRIRDPKLIVEMVKVGERSRSDVAIVYIEDLVELCSDYSEDLTEENAFEFLKEIQKRMLTDNVIGLDNMFFGLMLFKHFFEQVFVFNQQF